MRKIFIVSQLFSSTEFFPSFPVSHAPHCCAHDNDEDAIAEERLRQKQSKEQDGQKAEDAFKLANQADIVIEGPGGNS